MDAPTVEEIRALSNVDFEGVGVDDDSQLETLLTAAQSLLTAITGQTVAEMPDEFVPMANLAIRGFTEQLAYQGSAEYLETLSDFDLIQSFSAGPYSETRRSAEDAMKARKLNAWPWLSDLLWLMLTDEKREFWEDYFSDENAPAWAVTEVEWDPPLADDFIWGA